MVSSNFYLLLARAVHLSAENAKMAQAVVSGEAVVAFSINGQRTGDSRFSGHGHSVHLRTTLPEIICNIMGYDCQTKP